LEFLDRWVAACLVPLAVWILLSGLDDLTLDAACLAAWLKERFWPQAPSRWPDQADLDATPQQRIAVFVPLWREHTVIGKMLRQNIAVLRYSNYEFFVGVYPNDAGTEQAVLKARQFSPRIHVALCPHDGPTSKADCMNWIFQRMLLFEEEFDDRFDAVVIHDAEDLIHPESLRWINYFIDRYDMVQMPVLPLPTRGEWTHGFYCDDFAEFQTKDIPARQLLGGFLPSNGVGTGFSRAVLERLAMAHSNRIFEPGCLTEDYEAGFQIHRLGGPQLFVPIRRQGGTPIATREYFPRDFGAAVRQRTRWITGIVLQSWERHRWRDSAAQIYWLWRDRKGLIGNLATPVTNVLFLYGCATWVWSATTGRPWHLGRTPGGLWPWLFPVMLALPFFHLTVRAWCTARLYGTRAAMGVPLRAVWGNWLNFVATLRAVHQYARAKMAGVPLVWIKTDHMYPNRNALIEAGCAYDAGTRRGRTEEPGGFEGYDLPALAFDGELDP
jgi:bacteriophage N4 adsorption protein B